MPTSSQHTSFSTTCATMIHGWSCLVDLERNVSCMSEPSNQWQSILGSMAWFAFFVALIFRPGLVVDFPLLALVAVLGCAWWGRKAWRTRALERKARKDKELDTED